MKTDAVVFSGRDAAMALSVILPFTVTLAVTPAVAQTRSTHSGEYVDSAASHRLIRQNNWNPPPGVSVEQFDYCSMVPTPDSLVSTRLTVQPHAMATRTTNPAAGDYPLDSLPGYVVYVPPACVGAHRCPLVVFLHWGSVDAYEVLKWQRPVANTYGMIVLAPLGVVPKGAPPAFDPDEELVNRTNIDNALKQVLHKFAIDPDKIALAGHCNSGGDAMIWGGDNLDIFSRVLLFSTSLTTGGLDAPQSTDVRHQTQFYMDDGFEQNPAFFLYASTVRTKGFYVKHMISARGHSSGTESFDVAGQWLHESWMIPNPADRPKPAVIALPVLSAEAVQKMTTFWTAFQQLPDSIRTVARQAHQQELVVPVGDAHPSASLADMPTLAKQYPAIAALFTTAKLTPEQHDAYRIALMSALALHTFPTDFSKVMPNGDLAQLRDQMHAFITGHMTVSPTSVQGKNLAFITEYHDELRALAATKIWSTP
jgi:hypothetical protein